MKSTCTVWCTTHYNVLCCFRPKVFPLKHIYMYMYTCSLLWVLSSGPPCTCIRKITVYSMFYTCLFVNNLIIYLHVLHVCSFSLFCRPVWHMKSSKKHGWWFIIIYFSLQPMLALTWCTKASIFTSQKLTTSHYVRTVQNCASSAASMATPSAFVMS